LAALVEQLTEILKNADADGLDDKDKRNKRKIIIFSFFADTVDWIREYLEGVFASDLKLAAYRGRLACVIGDEGHGGVSREAAIFGFVPESSEAPAGRQDDLYDVLVTTDVLSEGMNLQQCRNIINYDLPWNPMRLVQRHGRPWPQEIQELILRDGTRVKSGGPAVEGFPVESPDRARVAGLVSAVPKGHEGKS
jgi:superfamily II DNA/RNA helicase